MNALDRTRKIIAQWPETDERISHGSPTWWGGKKTFANWADHHHGSGHVALWIKSTEEIRGILIDSNPDTFYSPPYKGPSGWLAVVIDKDTDWAQVEDLLLTGYKMVAPKRALKQLSGDAA